MADPRVVVAGVALRGRRLSASSVAGCRIALTEEHMLAGAGALGAVAAAGTARTTGVHVDLVARVGDDEAGTWTLAELIGRGVDVSRLSRWGTTGECLVIDSATAPPEVVLVPGLVDTDGVASALDACAPGDVLLVDACVLARHPEVVDLAYECDLQIVADLAPVIPGALAPGVVSRLDVAIVDAEGAGVLADSATPPASTAVFAGGLGAWWDDLRYLPPTGAAPAALVSAGPASSAADPDSGVPAVGMPTVGMPTVGAVSGTDGIHRFAGALAAGLAAGLDRPEAFTAAIAVALRRIEA